MNDCLATRVALRTAAAARTAAPEAALKHAASCPACDEVRRALAAVAALSAGPPLVSPAVRSRTLDAVQARAARPRTGLPALVLTLACAVASVTISLAVPFWLLVRTLLPLTGSRLVAGAGAASLIGLFGLAAGVWWLLQAVPGPAPDTPTGGTPCTADS